MFTLVLVHTCWNAVQSMLIDVVEDIASEMHHMNISAKMLNEVHRNFKDDLVRDFMIFYAVDSRVQKNQSFLKTQLAGFSSERAVLDAVYIK